MRKMKFALGAGVIAVTSLLGATAALAHGTGPIPGYLTDNNGHVVRSNYGLCWKTNFWTPAQAIEECDPDLVKKPEPAPAPKVEAPAPVAPAPVPAAPVGPAKPAFEKITLQAETLFDFDKAALRPDGKEKLNDVVTKMKQASQVELILVSGHADRIGAQKYNQRLSERRAEAVKSYLVSQGIAADRVETMGFGETQPAAECRDMKGAESSKNKKLVECLQPNRRVVVEIKVQRANQ